MLTPIVTSYHQANCFLLLEWLLNDHHMMEKSDDLRTKILPHSITLLRFLVSGSLKCNILATEKHRVHRLIDYLDISIDMSSLRNVCLLFQFGLRLSSFFTKTFGYLPFIFHF